MKKEFPHLAYRISHSLRTIAEQAIANPDNSLFPIYDDEDFRGMLAQRDLPVQEKLNLLLRYLGNLSDYPGQKEVFDIVHDYPILQARNSREADFYINSLKERSLIRAERIMPDSRISFALTTNGWIELERAAQSGSESSNGFIAMSFDTSRSVYDQAIERAITGAGYLALRIDRVPHVNRIDDEIIARIREAKFMVADFSGHNNGVYFEAGFMLGLGRPVVWVCEKSDMPKAHFDTRQYNTIDYEDAKDLEARLKFKLEAIFGKGPHRPG